MPGKRSLELKQYYGHGGNTFWKIMFDLFQKPYSTDYEIKTKLLVDNGIALWDVLKACERESSSDSDILLEEPNDFETFFQINSRLKTIFFNGKKAKEFFEKYVVAPNISCIALPSTSPANTWFTYDEKVEEWRSILKFI
ncbi:hypothetical protein ES708_07249 [subsurface metagenome]